MKKVLNNLWTSSRKKRKEKEISKCQWESIWAAQSRCKITDNNHSTRSDLFSHRCCQIQQNLTLLVKIISNIGVYKSKLAAAPFRYSRTALICKGTCRGFSNLLLDWNIRYSVPEATFHQLTSQRTRSRIHLLHSCSRAISSRHPPRTIRLSWCKSMLKSSKRSSIKWKWIWFPRTGRRLALRRLIGGLRSIGRIRKCWRHRVLNKASLLQDPPAKALAFLQQKELEQSKMKKNTFHRSKKAEKSFLVEIYAEWQSKILDFQIAHQNWSADAEKGKNFQIIQPLKGQK